MSFELQLADAVADCSDYSVGDLERIALTIVHGADAVEGLDEPLEVCLRLTSDAEIRELNHTFRGRDAATDVLAFALREAVGGEAQPHLLGDVVISVETADRQRKGSLASELEFLFAHGLCHLLGYDHHSDREEKAMNARAEAMLRAARA